ncbi:alpha/beta fold hydrolase [Pelagibacterium luteolum]|uniref:Pimeloyl-ACP methyl ester carboxylesterase n=1 Tax=Pelagibacterium luteolum TaxID=440168 RepID=A0A1G8AAT5_9HYPH|nr:alpha/beta hydrolase [Pelagibacterium luteolum]SDH18058.1 Pimeloyl-ACP methyl ester carboxylesterase [Pelagibacterium luteolum]
MIEHATLKAPGRTIGYRFGGSGPLIVLIASTGRAGSDFMELAEGLIERGFQVALPDPRGIGESDGRLEGIGFYDLADDVAHIIAAHAERGFVAGHAYGAWIARTVAQAHPERVAGLALLAAGAGKWPGHLSGAIDILCNPETSRDDKLAALRMAFFAPGNDPEDWLSGWHGPVMTAQRAARENTDDAWKRSGTAPILDLLALQDPFRPPQSYTFYKQTLGERVSVQTIDKASHALPHERPEAVAEALAVWIETLRPRS